MSTDNDTLQQYLEEHLQKNPNSILFARLADLYLKINKVEQAIQLCEEGIKNHPYYVSGHMVLGKCYLANKHYDQAEKEFKRVLLFDPKYLSAHKYYGDLMQEIGWENTCEDSYRKILQIDPLDEVARSRVGEFVIEGKTATEEKKSTVAQSKNTDIDINSIAPLPLTSKEEDIFYEESVQDSEPAEAEIDVQKTEIDDKKAEEFSSILDDIFEDEIVNKESVDDAKMDDVLMSEKDFATETQSKPDSFFENHESFDKDIEQPQLETKTEFDQFRHPEVSQDFASAEEHIKPVPDLEDGVSESYKEVKNKKSDAGKIVTPTLGEIYAAQGQFAKAINVFELLLKKHPDNETFAQKIEVLKQKLEEARNAPKN